MMVRHPAMKILEFARDDFDPRSRYLDGPDLLARSGLAAKC
jgi:hypothetical protein